MVPKGKSIFSTCGEGVIARNERTEISLLAPCTYEEADTRLMVHVLDAASRGHRRIRIRSNNKDVVLLVISVAGTLPTDELWVTFGPGKNVQNIPAHAIAISLGPDKAPTPPMFHALTGCDTVSFFGGRKKKNGLGCVESVSSTDTSAKSPQSVATRDRRGMHGCESKPGAAKALFKES